ncbi:hypothetical protein [Ensifer soli]|uniref:hypothetical protein n=1 Tax=Ciceribacter sp. sgz301302 TaxID=3342379 RepID=UPI0035B977EE
MRRSAVLAVLLLAPFPGAAEDGPAQSKTGAQAGAGCFAGAARLSGEEVGAFLAAPPALLSGHPDGGILLSARVRALAGSDRRTVDPLLGLVQGATPAQAAAIGAGFARAARACVAADPRYAAALQEKVAGLGDPAVDTAFEAAAGEVRTGSVDAPAAAVGDGTVAAAPIAGGGALGGGAAAPVASPSSAGFSVGGGGGSYAENEKVSPN